MLKVIGIYREDPHGYLAVARHDRPLDFVAYRKVLPQPYYWQIGASPKALFHVTIERSSGAVREAELICPGKHSLTDIPSGYRTLDREIGLPIVDTSEIPEYGLNETGDFYLVNEGSTRYVIFDPSLNPTSCMGIDRVGFFVSGELLCGLGFFDLTADEIEALEACLLTD